MPSSEILKFENQFPYTETEDQQQRRQPVRCPLLPDRRAADGEQADAIDDRVRCIVERVGGEGARIRRDARDREARGERQIEGEHDPKSRTLS